MKTSLNAAALLLLAGLALSSCGKKTPADQVKSNGLQKVEATKNISGVGDVAVVDIDSLASQCNYCKDGLKQLESKQNSYRNQLNAKGQALQNAMVAFQNKVQQGGFTSQQQAEAEQSRLQKQQQQLQAFQEKIENEMAKATKNYQEKLRKDVATFLSEYNKDGRYKVIISKSGDNVLYVSPTADITADVVEGLNKMYKK